MLRHVSDCSVVGFVGVGESEKKKGRERGKEGEKGIERQKHSPGGLSWF